MTWRADSQIVITKIDSLCKTLPRQPLSGLSLLNPPSRSVSSTQPPWWTAKPCARSDRGPWRRTREWTAADPDGCSLHERGDAYWTERKNFPRRQILQRRAYQGEVCRAVKQTLDEGSWKLVLVWTRFVEMLVLGCKRIKLRGLDSHNRSGILTLIDWIQSAQCLLETNEWMLQLVYSKQRKERQIQSSNWCTTF